MPVEPIRASVRGIDLSGRIAHTETVVASPSAAAETIIAQLTIPLDVQVTLGVFLAGWAAYTVGTNGTSVGFRIRQTNVSGSTIANSGLLTKTAASLYADDVNGFDASPPAAGVYCLTMIVTSG